MIQANELRLRNIVLYNGMMLRVSEILSPKPRKDKRFDGLHVVELLCDGLISVPINEVSEVELTEEILLKCGFFKREDGKFEIAILDYGYVMDFLSWRDDWTMGVLYYDPMLESEIDVIYSFISPGLKYFHQLQNLFFALTGKELEVKL